MRIAAAFVAGMNDQIILAAITASAYVIDWGRILPRVNSASSRLASVRACDSDMVGKRPIVMREFLRLRTNVFVPPCDTRKPKLGSLSSQYETWPFAGGV